MHQPGFASRGLRFLKRHWQDWRRPEAQALRQLKHSFLSWPRFRTGNVKVWGWDLEFVDPASFLSAFEAIVVQGCYDFRTHNPSPYILDCGSNIGIAALHFKRLFPRAEIVAFEPDPIICQTLRRNLLVNNAADVQVVEGALWDKAGKTVFFREGADGGRLGGGSESTRLEVMTVRLADYLTKPVAMLKIDIEGAETRVIYDITQQFDMLIRLVIEYHVISQTLPSLGKILSLLEDKGFNYYVNSISGGWIDFVHPPQKISDWLDQFLIIYAQRNWK